MNAQEQLWQGQFGTEYQSRSPGSVSCNTVLFSDILSRTYGVKSVLEYGAGAGRNLIAIRNILPGARLAAVEINPVAGSILRSSGIDHVFEASVTDETDLAGFDFVFTKGLLIHISPEKLYEAYDALYRTSRQYICVCEYFNPTPVNVHYRGHEDMLFKRDFAGEMLDRYEGLRLIDYGFVWDRDPFPQDNVTWFLMTK